MHCYALRHRAYCALNLVTCMKVPGICALTQLLPITYHQSHMTKLHMTQLHQSRDPTATYHISPITYDQTAPITYDPTATYHISPITYDQTAPITYHPSHMTQLPPTTYHPSHMTQLHQARLSFIALHCMCAFVFPLCMYKPLETDFNVCSAPQWPAFWDM